MFSTRYPLNFLNYASNENDPPDGSGAADLESYRQ
jgi:hypothetical protein